MAAVPIQVLAEFFFSQIIGKKIYDSAGLLIGKIRDIAVKWDGSVPVVTGIQFQKDPDNQFDILNIEQWNPKGVVLKNKWSDIQTRSLADAEFYTGKCLLDKQIIDLNGSKVVRVNDIALAWLKQGDKKKIVLTGVDIGSRGLFRRLGLEFLVAKRPQYFVSWQHIKPLENKIDNLYLRTEFEKLKNLHPADIADIMEDLDQHERKNLLKKLEHDQAADVLAEVNFDMQLEIVKSMEQQHAADILKKMPVDEAADILGELPEKSSRQILALMEPAGAKKVKELMTYPAGTVGALMTTEYMSLVDSLTANETINLLREASAYAETIYYLYIVDKDGFLQGVLSLRELIIAHPKTKLKDLMCTQIITVNPGDASNKAVDIVSKYGLIALPVVSDDNKLLGIITIDDIFATVLPDQSELKTFPNYMRFSRRKWINDVFKAK